MPEISLYVLLDEKAFEKGPEFVADICSRWLKDNVGLAIQPRELHITEQKYPEQTKRFRELLEEEYQTHLEKNADYSAWNVNATGQIGLVVRMWDKMARIMSLTGFDIGTGKFSGEKLNQVKDETIVDTAKDMGVYAKIFRIFSEGKWGK